MKNTFACCGIGSKQMSPVAEPAARVKMDATSADAALTTSSPEEGTMTKAEVAFAGKCADAKLVRARELIAGMTVPERRLEGIS